MTSPRRRRRAPEPVDAPRRPQTKFYGDNPVDTDWLRIWARAKNARFLFTDADADAWREKRLVMRHGYCAAGSRVTSTTTSLRTTALRRHNAACNVPLAFTPGWKLQDAFALNTASPASVHAAWAALRSFVTCAVPSDRLLWMNLASNASAAWPSLLRFLDKPPDARLRDRPGGGVPLSRASFPHWGESNCTIEGTACSAWLCAKPPDSEGGGFL